MDCRVCLLEAKCKELMVATDNLMTSSTRWSHGRSGPTSGLSEWKKVLRAASQWTLFHLCCLMYWGKTTFNPIKVDTTPLDQNQCWPVTEGNHTKVHHEKNVWHILHLARQFAPLNCDERNFADYTTEVLAQRMAFSVVRKKICAFRVTCSLRYSALLWVVHNNITKKSPAEAERFADSL